MSHRFDEFSKALAEPVPRRESLRRFGLVLFGTILGPFGTDGASAAGIDPCKGVCTRGTKKQKDACLATCRACLQASGRACGSNTNLICCPSGANCCGTYCANLATDFDNCGRCGLACREPRENEVGACANGRCQFACVAGAVYCNGRCKFLGSDPNNCGTCGRTCGGTKPYCRNGACVSCPGGLAACGGNCVDLQSDRFNCGSCGNACGGTDPVCVNGVCGSADPCPAGFASCNGVCIDVYWDSQNCGACGVVCPEQTACAAGVCEGLSLN